MTLGTDLTWADGDVADDLSFEVDPSESYIQRIGRLLTCNGLWYAPTKTLDVKGYLLDTASDDQIQIEIQQKVEGDEETARCEVQVTRSGGTVAVGITAWTKRGQIVKFTLAIDLLTGDLLVNG